MKRLRPAMATQIPREWATEAAFDRPKSTQSGPRPTEPRPPMSSSTRPARLEPATGLTRAPTPEEWGRPASTLPETRSLTDWNRSNRADWPSSIAAYTPEPAPRKRVLHKRVLHKRVLHKQVLHKQVQGNTRVEARHKPGMGRHSDTVGGSSTWEAVVQSRERRFQFRRSLPPGPATTQGPARPWRRLRTLQFSLSWQFPFPGTLGMPRFFFYVPKNGWIVPPTENRVNPNAVQIRNCPVPKGPSCTQPRATPWRSLRSAKTSARFSFHGSQGTVYSLLRSEIDEKNTLGPP